ncbi:hypothetical protein MANES_15G190551v8, partial [Manihot esculenta]
IKVNHLCFADVLFLFSHGDYESVKGLGNALKHFEIVSGLQVNDSKSSVYFVRVSDQVKRQILQTLNFREGTLPVTYLGVPLVSRISDQVKRQILQTLNFREGKFPVTYLRVPLVSTAIKNGHCISLIDKIMARVSNWVAK